MQTTTSKKAHSAPLVIGEHLNDDLEKMYVLDNGNQILADKYNSIWNPPKSQVNWKAKAANPDRTKIS